MAVALNVEERKHKKNLFHYHYARQKCSMYCYMEHVIARFAWHTATWDRVYSRGGKSPYTIPTVVDDHVQRNGLAPQSHDS